MNAPARIAMNLEQFLDWEKRQGVRYELVDGVPRMLTGGTRAHDLVSLNVFSALRQRARGGPCQAQGSNLKVVIPTGNVRYPDALLDCGPRHNDDLFATEPTLIFEVLSDSTGYFDQTQKLEEYQSVETVEAIVFLAQDKARGRIWRRADGAWASEDVEGLDFSFALPRLSAPMQMAEFYDGVTLAPADQAKA
jgi:Uma2 family endonuclease